MTLQVYAGRRVGASYSALWRPWLQLVSGLLAAATSLSRVSDHRHHPVDVAAGAALGLLLGLAAAWGAVTPAEDRSALHPRYERQKKNSAMPLLHSGFGWVGQDRLTVARAAGAVERGPGWDILTSPSDHNTACSTGS